MILVYQLLKYYSVDVLVDADSFLAASNKKRAWLFCNNIA
jgi:hypothetical protein